LLLRIKIVLEAAEGTSTREIARELDTTPTTVSLWRGRFAREGLAGLDDLPRSGAPPVYGEATDKRIRAVRLFQDPSGWTPHCVGAHVPGEQQVPSLPHVVPPAHDPQSRVPPQPSGQEPHCLPSPAHVAEHEQVPSLHAWLPGQDPQSRVPPQPSGQVPHW